MKRSTINGAIAWSKELLFKNNIFLPKFAYWSMDEWRANADRLDTIRKVMLGWDVSDSGMGKFDEMGAVLFTVRNGKLDDPSVGVPYCEKLIVMKDGQRLPKHFHKGKAEDIINRAGGVLQLFLFNTDPATDEAVDTPVTVFMDGIEHTFQPGEEVLVYPGNSITLPPRIAHIFGPKPGAGDLIVGEVSSINDDLTDNYHLEKVNSQYAEVEEDEPILHPLCNEYARVLN